MTKEKHLMFAEGSYHLMQQDAFGLKKNWEYSMYLHLFRWAGWKE